METGIAAVGRIITDVKLDVLRQVYREVRRINVVKAAIKVHHPRLPPLDVNVPEVHATAALEHRASVAGNNDGNRVVDDRIQPQMVRTRACFVELRPHRRVLKLQLVACVIL